MPWVRVDDHFDGHPKMAAVGPVGWGFWLAGLAYSNRNLTDGFVPYSVAEGIGGAWLIREPVEDPEELENGVRDTRNGERVWSVDIGSGHHGQGITSQWVIDLLVRVGLWESVPGGYLIHDYEDYQPTKAQVEADRAAKIAAGQAGGRASAVARAKAPARHPVQQNPSRTPSRPQAEGQAKSNPVPVPVPKPLTVPSGTVHAHAGDNGDDRWTATLLVEELTSRPFGYRAGSQVFDTLSEDVAQLGLAKVSAMYRTVASEANGTPLDAAGIVFGAHKRMYLIPDAPRRTAAEAKADERAELLAKMRGGNRGN